MKWIAPQNWAFTANTTGVIQIEPPLDAPYSPAVPRRIGKDLSSVTAGNM